MKNREAADLDDVIAAQRANVARDGYSILPGALSADLCDQTLREIGIMSGVWDRALVQSFHGLNTIRYYDLLNAGPVFQRVPVLAPLLGVARAVLGADCLLGTYGTASIGPGEKAQTIHADDGVYGLRRPHPDIYLNAVIALSDFTEENGATRIVHGSHLWPRYPAMHAGSGRAELAYETCPAVMSKGSACFVLGTTYHGGGENRTGEHRHGITLAYCAGWVRPQENFTVAVAQEKAAEFDPELLALMGYRANRNRLGHIYADEAHSSGALAHLLRRAPDQPILP